MAAHVGTLLLKFRGQGSVDCKGGFITMNIDCEGGMITKNIDDGLSAKDRLAVAVPRLDCSLLAPRVCSLLLKIVNHRCRMVGGSC